MEWLAQPMPDDADGRSRGRVARDTEATKQQGSIVY